MVQEVVRTVSAISIEEGEKNVPRYRLEGDRHDKSRPSVDIGDWGIVTGKQAERMKGGHYSFVRCRIRVATGATHILGNSGSIVICIQPQFLDLAGERIASPTQ